MIRIALENNSANGVPPQILLLVPEGSVPFTGYQISLSILQRCSSRLRDIHYLVVDFRDIAEVLCWREHVTRLVVVTAHTG